MLFYRTLPGSLIITAMLLCGFYPTMVQAQNDAPPTMVTVVTLVAQDITLTTTLPGRVVASGVAEVRPQVSGIIIEQVFEEGRPVSQGDEMFRIEPSSYAAQLAAADAAVAQAQATLRAAEKADDRMRALLERQVVSQQVEDDAVAAHEAAMAALQVARARQLSAQIDLDRTTIRAQLSGWVGRSLTTQGALVTAGQATPMAVIRKLDPVYVDVTQSAAELIRWRRGNADAELGEADPTVVLTLADGDAYGHTGQLTAAEPYVNELTGVVLLRLKFPNPDKLLLPGMYVQVELPQGIATNSILAPQEGVTRDRRGNPIAMVVNAQNIVEQRDLTVVNDRGAFWIVSKGLNPGDRIIVAGLQKIGVGMTVVAEERATATPSDAAASVPTK